MLTLAVILWNKCVFVTFTLLLCFAVTTACAFLQNALHRGLSPQPDTLAQTHCESWDYVTMNHDWSQPYPSHNYDDDKRRKQFEQAGGVFYQKSCLSPEEFKLLRSELNLMSLKLVHETSNSVGRKRMGAKLPSDCSIIKTFREDTGSLSQLIHSLMGGNQKMVLSRHVPIELRVYETMGSGMEWHVDDVLFDPPQLEIVYTLENTSDCVTSYEKKDMNGAHQSKRVNIESEPNSAIILRAGGVNHCVSSLKYGKRVILKIVYVQENARLLETGLANQFHSKRSKNGKRKRRKTKR